MKTLITIFALLTLASCGKVIDPLAGQIFNGISSEVDQDLSKGISTDGPNIDGYWIGEFADAESLLAIDPQNLLNDDIPFYRATQKQTEVFYADSRCGMIDEDTVSKINPIVIFKSEKKKYVLDFFAKITFNDNTVKYCIYDTDLSNDTHDAAFSGKYVQYKDTYFFDGIDAPVTLKLNHNILTLSF